MACVRLAPWLQPARLAQPGRYRAKVHRLGDSSNDRDDARRGSTRGTRAADQGGYRQAVGRAGRLLQALLKPLRRHAQEHAP